MGLEDFLRAEKRDLMGFCRHIIWPKPSRLLLISWGWSDRFSENTGKMLGSRQLHLWGDATTKLISTKFGLSRELSDFINCANFGSAWSVEGFLFSGGSKLAFSYT
jgi:hypothetical protein